MQFRLCPGCLVRTIIAVALSAATTGLADEPAEQNPYEGVPQAPVIVHVRNPDRLQKRLSELFQTAFKPDSAPEVMAGLARFAAATFGERRLEGLAADSSLFVVFPQLPQNWEDDFPHWALIANVSDERRFREALLTVDERDTFKRNRNGLESALLGGVEVYFRRRGSRLIVTPDQELALSSAATQFRLDGKLSSQLLASDVAVYVNLQEVAKSYGERFQEVRDVAILILQATLREQGQSRSHTNPLQSLVQAVWRILQDSRSVLIGLQFEPEGVRLRLETSVVRDSATGKQLANERPVTMEELGTMPAGKPFYSGVALSPSTLQLAHPLAYFTDSDLDAATWKPAREALLRHLDVQPRLLLNAAAAGLKSEGLEVWLGGNPQAATETRLAFYETLPAGTILNAGVLREKPILLKRAHNRHGFQLHQARFRWDFKRMAQAYETSHLDAVDLRQLISREGNCWFGSNGKVFAELTGSDWYSAQAYLEEFVRQEHPLKQDPAFQAARRQLPANVSLLGFLDVNFGVQTALANVLLRAGNKITPQFASSLNELLVENQPVGASGYFGGAAVLEPDRVSVEAWIPAAALGRGQEVLEKLAAARPAPR
ncbi:MAG: hypothetical protein ACKV2Q_05205 [Planctomycetaceae bacterium]